MAVEFMRTAGAGVAIYGDAKIVRQEFGND
jgi:hypothetical protein